jgi:hypothetical protein
MTDTYRIYLNPKDQGNALAAFLLTKLGLLALVGEGYVEVPPRAELDEAALTAAVEEWISSVESVPQTS